MSCLRVPFVTQVFYLQYNLKFFFSLFINNGCQVDTILPDERKRSQSQHDEITIFVERYTQQVSKKAPLLPIGVAFDFITHTPRSLGVAG
jgi:hypothetical protein